MPTYIIDVIVDGALDETIHTDDLASALATVAESCVTVDAPVELHIRPEHVEHAGEYTDDGSSVIRWSHDDIQRAYTEATDDVFDGRSGHSIMLDFLVKRAAEANLRAALEEALQNG